MKKSALVMFCFAFASLVAVAQSVPEGINHLNAERKASAKATFEKILAANPNNIEAIYWLGQSVFTPEKATESRKIYERALSTNGNAPLLLVGMGQVELSEGKKNEARQRFETALSLSRGKKGDDPAILNAIGRANVEARNGDIAYAISKLTAAAAAAPNNSEIFINLGNAYRKARDGGSAASNYRKAAQANAASPVPYYRLAQLYKTQKNWEVVVENLNQAVSIDPKFAPAYLQLYDYNLNVKRDFTAAEKLANQYVSIADQSVENDYLKAQTAFVQKKYDEAISMGKNILAASGNNVNPRVFRLLAYSNLEKGDTVGARIYVDQFFAQDKSEDDMVPMDYLLKAYVYLREKPELVREAIMSGVQADTILSNQVSFLNEVIAAARKAKLPLVEADARMVSYQLRGTKANPAELYLIGVPYYQAGQFQKSDSIFQGYSKAFPDSIYGYLWSARSLASLDAGMKQGLAIPQYEQLLRTAAMDKIRLKAYGLEAAGQLANYYANNKNDRTRAIEYLNRGLEFDPENANFQNAIKQLTASGNRAAAAPRGTSKTSTSSGQAKEVKVKTEAGKTKVKKG